VLGTISRLCPGRVGDRGAAGLASEERGGVREHGRGSGVLPTVGHSAPLSPPPPAPASCSTKWSQEPFFGNFERFLVGCLAKE